MKHNTYHCFNEALNFRPLAILANPSRLHNSEPSLNSSRFEWALASLFLFTSFTGSAASGCTSYGRENKAATAGVRGQSVSGPRHSADCRGRLRGDLLQPCTGNCLLAGSHCGQGVPETAASHASPRMLDCSNNGTVYCFAVSHGTHYVHTPFAIHLTQLYGCCCCFDVKKNRRRSTASSSSANGRRGTPFVNSPPTRLRSEWPLYSTPLGMNQLGNNLLEENGTNVDFDLGLV